MDEKPNADNWLRQSIVRYHEYLYRAIPLIFVTPIRWSSYSIPHDELIPRSPIDQSTPTPSIFL